jgi:hypothetical protein
MRCLPWNHLWKIKGSGCDSRGTPYDKVKCVNCGTRTERTVYARGNILNPHRATAPLPPWVRV